VKIYMVIVPVQTCQDFVIYGSLSSAWRYANIVFRKALTPLSAGACIHRTYTSLEMCNS